MTESRRKGKDGELELAKLLRKLTGRECRRGQQYCGASGDADVIGLPGIHIECKRVERLNLYDAVEQGERDSQGSGKLVTVMHRRNRKPWLVTMPMEDWIEMYRVWEKGA